MLHGQLLSILEERGSHVARIRGLLFIVVSKQAQSVCVISDFCAAQAVLIFSMGVLYIPAFSPPPCRTLTPS